MLEVAKIDKKVQPVIQKCLEEMEKAANAIDPKLVESYTFCKNSLKQMNSDFLILRALTTYRINY